MTWVAFESARSAAAVQLPPRTNNAPGLRSIDSQPCCFLEPTELDQGELLLAKVVTALGLGEEDLRPGDASRVLERGCTATCEPREREVLLDVRLTRHGRSIEAIGEPLERVVLIGHRVREDARLRVVDHDVRWTILRETRDVTRVAPRVSERGFDLVTDEAGESGEQREGDH